jgi:hypothetical protein
MSSPPGLAINEEMLARVLREHGVQVVNRLVFGPSGWDMRIAQVRGGPGSLIVTQAEQDDGEEWLHASIAWRHNMPTYDDLTMLHRAVFGRRRWAYQVFTPDTEHVNIHRYALHLWGRADGARVLPDFGRFGSI